MRYQIEIAYGDWADTFETDDAEKFIEESINEIEKNEDEPDFTMHFAIFDTLSDEKWREEYVV